MTSSPQDLFLLRHLISFDTINPPGNEEECASFIGEILVDHGYEVKSLEFAPKRTSLVAISKARESGKSAICFCGHMDTVPLGNAPWQHGPFSGEIVGDKIYGRGASDMKSGLVAMIITAVRLAEMGLNERVLMLFTAGEETFCQGARYVAERHQLLGHIGGLIVCEPTSNRPVIGHKGAIHYKITFRGKTAHASMPHMGINAIYKASDAIQKLRNLDLGVSGHPLLGPPTINVGTMSGGQNINSVPDLATIGVDIRTLPDQTEEKIRTALQDLLGTDVDIELLGQARGIFTEPGDPWVKEVFRAVEDVTGARPEPSTVPYFTDASMLSPALGSPPTVILGPGEPELAHKTDEYCYIHKIEEAAQIYLRILESWCLK